MTEMTAQSIRHRILLDMISRFEAVQPMDPAPPAFDPTDWPLKFSTVALGPLSEEDHRKRFTLGLVPAPERYTNLFPYQERFLQVGIEFRVTVNKGDDPPGELFEQLLTVVERVVQGNRTWGGLAIDTQFDNNEQDMVTYGARSILGVLYATIQYRHSHQDSRDPQPAV